MLDSSEGGGGRRLRGEREQRAGGERPRPLLFYNNRIFFRRMPIFNQSSLQPCPETGRRKKRKKDGGGWPSLKFRRFLLLSKDSKTSFASFLSSSPVPSPASRWFVDFHSSDLSLPSPTSPLYPRVRMEEIVPRDRSFQRPN